MKSTLTTARAIPVTTGPALTRSMATSVPVNPATRVSNLYTESWLYCCSVLTVTWQRIQLSLFFYFLSTKAKIKEKLPKPPEERAGSWDLWEEDKH